MNMDDYLSKEEWKLVTQYMTCCKANLGESLDYNINLSLFCDTEEQKMVGQSIGYVSSTGLHLNRKHRYLLHSIATENGFVIFAKLRE